jgi:hypothetical protein
VCCGAFATRRNIEAPVGEVSQASACACVRDVPVCRFLMVDQVAANYDFSWFRALGQAVLGGRTPDG